MTFALLGAAVTLLALPGATARWGRRLKPSEWSQLCVAALVVGSLLLEVSLVLRAAPTVLRVAGVDALASACARLLGPLTVGGDGLGWSAALAAALLPLTAAITSRRLHAARRRVASEVWLGERKQIAGQMVVVLPLDRPLALSFDRPEPTIVVSEGLVSTLDAHEVDAVIRHELAHLVHRHQYLRYLVAVLTAGIGWFPPVRASTAAMHLSLERWADEDAAGTCPARRLAVRDALLHLVLLDDAPLGTVAFSSADTVVVRVDALDVLPSPPSRVKHALLYLPCAGASVVAIPALLTWTAQANTVFAMAGRCTV